MHKKMNRVCSKSVNLAMLGSGSCMKALAGAVQPKSPPCGTRQQYYFALGKLTGVFLAHTPRDTPFVRETVAERQQKLRHRLADVAVTVRVPQPWGNLASMAGRLTKLLA